MFVKTVRSQFLAPIQLFQASILKIRERLSLEGRFCHGEVQYLVHSQSEKRDLRRTHTHNAQVGTTMFASILLGVTARSCGIGRSSLPVTAGH